MSEWSLGQLLSTLHEDIHRRLEASRKSFGHSTTKGNATEGVWLKLLQEYLPQRYAAETGHVVDSEARSAIKSTSLSSTVSIPHSSLNTRINW
jgi:hypothetical protein